MCRAVGEEIWNMMNKIVESPSNVWVCRSSLKARAGQDPPPACRSSVVTFCTADQRSTAQTNVKRGNWSMKHKWYAPPQGTVSVWCTCEHTLCHFQHTEHDVCCPKKSRMRKIKSCSKIHIQFKAPFRTRQTINICLSLQSIHWPVGSLALKWLIKVANESTSTVVMSGRGIIGKRWPPRSLEFTDNTYCMWCKDYCARWHLVAPVTTHFIFVYIYLGSEMCIISGTRSL